MKIGILSDTHGLLRPETLHALNGCEAILHGGDINKPEIIEKLEAIAPVYVVRGNNDRDWAAHIPMSLDFELAGMRVYMTHKKRDLPADLSPYSLVVFGHSHRWEEVWQGNTLLLNPGSCGPRRFNQAITLALLDSDTRTVTRIDIPNQSAPKAETMNLKSQIETVMRETAKGRGPRETAARHGWDAALVEQIARLYVTHPGVTADGIMRKMGL